MKDGDNEGESRPSAIATGKASDVVADLNRLETMIGDLKVLYEQHFLGVLSFPPDKEHNQLKLFMRTLRKAPFKNSATVYRLRALETRYGTLNTYWQRVLREKENGTYIKDVFKANMRERHALEDAYAQTAKGKANRSMQTLFESYRDALEKSTGRKHNLDFEQFRRSLVKRAKEFKEQHGNRKLSFKVIVREGKVSVQAVSKE